MSEKEPRYIRQAEEVIDNAAERALGKSYERLEKVRHKPACGCLTCKREAVRDMNDAVDFISKGKDPIEWYVDKKGEIQWRSDQDALNEMIKKGKRNQ